MCGTCERDISWISSASCARCGAPRRGGSCRWCPQLDPAIDRARSACVYAGPARDAVKSFKLLGERRTARWLAARMAPAARVLDANVVTWVPATRGSEAARGFNPAEELARPLALMIRRPARRLLIKRRETRDSAGLSREQRRANLYEAFASSPAVRGNVILVDDILTTGATAGECAAALKGAGARSVSVVTFARAL